MITIDVDYGYAFDYLAILEVKNRKMHSAESQENFNKCYKHLRDQIDQEKWDEVIRSKQYSDMIDANAKTFEAVEQARYGNTTAKHVDDCNMERFHCKKNLQKKFFPDAISVEIKS
jgi:hypothetical protein